MEPAFMKKYPHRAWCPVAVRPEEVRVDLYGHHGSWCPARGVREYGFQIEAARDRFCKQTGATAGKFKRQPTED